MKKDITPATMDGNTVERVFRKDRRQNFEKLCDQISKLSQSDGVSFENYTWAPPLSQQEWADRIGVNPRTLRRLIKYDPIVSTTRGMSNDKATLLRIGVAGPDNPRKMNNTLCKIWREHVGREISTHKEYGLCCGLTEAWPDGWQPRILKHTLARWNDFWFATALEMEVANACISEDPFTPSAWCDPMLATARRWPGEQFVIRRYKFANLGFLRKFNHVALDLFVAHRQDTNQKYPPIYGQGA